MKKLHNCEDCAFQYDGFCDAMRDKDGKQKPIHDKPTDCDMFILLPIVEDN